MITERDILIDVAALGDQVEAFFDSRVGKFIIQRINFEVERSVEQLKKVDPSKTEEVRAIQNEIWRAETLRQWLEESVTAGLKALEVLEERDDGHDY
jgi:hypothetical protein